MRRTVNSVASLLTLGRSCSASRVAQAPANDAVFRYRGADRDARLVERAKREGSVVLYTSLAPTESQPLADAFQKKYGIKVVLWRALSDQVVQRVVAEARGRRHAVDVIETNGPEMEMLAREKLLARAPLSVPRGSAARRHSRRTARGFPIGSTSTSWGSTPRRCSARRFRRPTRAFSTRNGRGASRIEATDAEWMATLVKTWGEAKGMDYFRKLAALGPTCAGATFCWPSSSPPARCPSA